MIFQISFIRKWKETSISKSIMLNSLFIQTKNKTLKSDRESTRVFRRLTKILLHSFFIISRFLFFTRIKKSNNCGIKKKKFWRVLRNVIIVIDEWLVIINVFNIIESYKPYETNFLSLINIKIIRCLFSIDIFKKNTR